jgi:phage gpG-like protein
MAIQKKDTGPDKLYRVFKADGRPAYLPSRVFPNGLPLEEAERLSASLAVDTEVRLVWERPEEE